MSEAAFHALIAAADAYLAALPGPGVADVRAGIAQARTQPFQTVVPRANRVADQHLAGALEFMRRDGHGGLAEAIAAAAPHLAWVTYDAYPRAEIGDFAERHAFTSLIGEAAAFAAEDSDFGLFLIAPETLYRDHHHAAPELYAPLTGPHGWRFDPKAPFTEKPAHAPVWNEPWQPHATLVGAVPFLCLFGWTRDATQPAKVIL